MGMKDPYSHELPPEKIKTVDAVKKHLCNLAYQRGTVYPEQCQKCKSVCKYGFRLLDLLGLEYIPQKEELRVKDINAQGKALPTIHQRLRRRGK